jgi:hypothetical protein
MLGYLINEILLKWGFWIEIMGIALL